MKKPKAMRRPPTITTFLGPILSLMRPAGKVMRPKTRQIRAKAKATSGTVHPNCFMRGLIKTLKAYNSKPQDVLPKRPPSNGIHLGKVVPDCDIYALPL
jgi:hypothetical protein